MAGKVKGKKKADIHRTLPLLLIALPGIIYLIINNYVPMLGLFLAFKDYNFMKGIFKSDWCGFQNFKFLFATKDALVMTRNTILYNLAFIIIGTAFAIFIAILMCELGKRLRVKLFQASLLLPNLLSWVVIGFVAYAFLNADTGFINKTILEKIGAEPIAWYTY
ncbi:MAG: sugar ABC transporter permease, partial [Lachnospiraceae bacterium]|nr:sugar ABC transporter permease [Lachnospiraceae bacterium]